MALLIYGNGLVEEFKPQNLVFDELELLSLFNGYDKVESFRLDNIVNTWCLWGYSKNSFNSSDEYNKLGSELIHKNMYSPILLIHDSEININWNISDDMLYKSYSEFIKDVQEYIDDLVNKLSENREDEIKESDKNGNLIILKPEGWSQDKRLLFKFNTKEQSESFYLNGGYEKFLNKCENYLEKNYFKESSNKDNVFILFSDKQTIIYIDDENVKDFIDKAIKFFTSSENYEACSFLTKVNKDREKIIKNEKNNK